MSLAQTPTPRPHFKYWPRRLPRELVIPETSLWFNLEVSAARYPDKAANIYGGRTLTYRELKQQAEALAGWLRAQGVEKGDRVALFLQNCPQYVIAFYAVMRADAVVVPVNPMNRADEFGHYITDPDTKVVICAADLAGVVDTANQATPADKRLRAVLVTHYADRLPEVVNPDLGMPATMEQWLRATPALPDGMAHWNDAVAHAPITSAHSAQADDLAMLPYTSGTTGLPKGCWHTHRTLMANAMGSPWSFASAETVALAVVPMFHITGMMYGVIGAIASGCTQIIMPRWDREMAGRSFARYGITHWTCIPTMVMDLFASPNYKTFDLTSLVNVSGGGAAMPQAVAERLQQEYGITFAEGYGLTETAAPSHANPPDRAKLQCLGMPIFGVDSRVVDPVTLQEVPVGEVGEIVTHGPMVFKGYWKHPAATEAAFFEMDGKSFFRTGDLGRMDEEGYFFITDRLKRMINASGFKIWPSEVELLLYKHPSVLEACIISAKDAYRGETVKAFVVLRPEARGDATEQSIIDWSREHMAAYKVPRVVEFVEALPKSGSGKVMWRALQEAENAREASA